VRLTRKQFLLAGTTGLAALQPAAAAAPPVALDVRAHGAAGDGAADDTASIQGAIDAAPADGGVVLLPPGVYRLTRPLEVVDDAAHGHRRALQIVGATGGASGGGMGCRLEWDGPADAPMLRLWSRDCLVRHLAFRVRAGRRTPAAIDVDQAPDQRAISTNNTFEHLLLTSGPGHMVDGVVLGARARSNVEMMGFSECYFEDLGRAGIHIVSRTGQSKAHRLYKCGFSRAQFGILHETGSFVTYGCAFGYLTEAAVRLSANTDYIAINETDSEGCAHFLSTAGGSSASWPVKIAGGRLALNGLAPDGRYIDFTNGGPLLIENVLFEGPAPGFRIRAASVGPGAVLVSLGNVFPNASPYDTSGRCRVISLGNRGRDAAGAVANLDDEIVAAGGAHGRLALTSVASISGTAVRSQNLRGSVRLAGPQASALVRFGAPEPDAVYFVSAVVAGVTGRPASGATRVSVRDKTASGFTIVLEAAPGPESAATVDWLLVR
jgi:hypothetical protein